MGKYVVYRHVFPDGCSYVGATSNYKKRWGKGSGYSYDKNLFRKILEFGWKNIFHEIIYSGLSKEEAVRLETIEILKEKGNNPKCLNKKKASTFPKQITEETRRKISQAGYGRKQNKQFVDMMRSLHKGNQYSLGLKRSNETKRRMSIAHIGIKAYNHRPILQYSKNMEFIKEWDCIMDVQRAFGYLNSALIANLKRKTKSSYGFIWRYKNESSD